jgi:hypothetical protein
MPESAGTNLGRPNTQRGLLLKFGTQKDAVKFCVRNVLMFPMLLVMPVLGGGLAGRG